jgi:vesicle coat complex subunit
MRSFSWSVSINDPDALSFLIKFRQIIYQPCFENFNKQKELVFSKLAHPVFSVLRFKKVCTNAAFMKANLQKLHKN